MITPLLLRSYAWMQARYPEILWRGDPSRREIALTFDDGPHPTHTPLLLDILGARRQRATFYVIGRDVETNQNIVKRIHAGGHEIGIHCHRHIPFPLERPEFLHSQLKRTQELISQACGVSTAEIRDLRPPYGLFTAKTNSMLAGWGYRLVMWNCIPPHFLQPFDWTIQQILDSSLPGSIIVLHDGHGHGSRAEHIVEAVVPKLKSQGFEFVTIQEMQSRKNP